MSPRPATVSTTGTPAWAPRTRDFGTLLDLTASVGTITTNNTAPDAAYGRLPSSTPRRTVPDDPAGFRGHPKFCPLCDRSFGHFNRFGLARRKNAQCPRCGSLERHRYLWLYLDKITRLSRRRLRVLHFAPEGCIRDRLTALPSIRYTAADLFRPETPLRLDITNLALPDASVDLVLCSHVLEHVEKDGDALREIRRVLAPAGRAIIMVPLDLRRETFEDESVVTAAARLAAFGHPYHVRICGNDYEERIARAGFSVQRVDSAALQAHHRRYLRINKTSLFDCRPLPPKTQP